MILQLSVLSLLVMSVACTRNQSSSVKLKPETSVTAKKCMCDGSGAIIGSSAGSGGSAGSSYWGSGSEILNGSAVAGGSNAFPSDADQNGWGSGLLPVPSVLEIPQSDGSGTGWGSGSELALKSDLTPASGVNSDGTYACPCGNSR